MYDDQIRKAFIEYLLRKKPRPFEILEEVPVSNGKAIADIVSVHKLIHCYEIKGSRDKVSRTLVQDKEYSLNFPKLTLITTQQQADVIKLMIPAHWGIIVAFQEKDEIKFKYLLPAKYNPYQLMHTSLQILWKDEMLKITSKYKVKLTRKNFTRKELAEIISSQLTKTTINYEISNMLSERSRASSK